LLAIAGMTFDDYISDRKIVYAVTRAFALSFPPLAKGGKNVCPGIYPM
jgi:hypothetical protein